MLGPKLVDDSAENEFWTPHGLSRPHDPHYQYPIVKARSISCFMQMCRLSVIFNQILLHMYDSQRRNSPAEIHACLHKQGDELRRWWEQLPDILKVDPGYLSSYAPPSHIVTLK